MRNYSRPSFFAGLPPVGPATRWLCTLLVGVSVVAAMCQRRFGYGTEELVFRTEAVLRLELWRLVTYAFVDSSVMGLVLSGLGLFLLGRSCEGSWGTRDYLRFFFISTVGGALLAMPIGWVINLIMPFHDMGMAEGPGAAIDAMLVALAINAPNSNVMFGFVLPMPIKSTIWLLLGLGLISGLMTGASTLSITLGGMLMGYFLVTGSWRPRQLIKLWRTMSLQKKRRDGLYVVPPRDKHTLN